MPVGIQDFEKLRTTNNVYVDKTDYLYRLVSEEKPFFLGRPRRFGKSLFISTLKAYFLGKKQLFEELAIDALEKDWIEYPVIYIDFNKGNCYSLQSIIAVLEAILSDYENQWGITEKSSDLSVRFSTLIKVANTKSGKKVVVLIDEYDKPLINSMDEPQTNTDLLKFLKGFYGVLKAMDYCLRFVFLTGVTKFSRVSIFSDLNHLIDISLDDQFAGICGISETELFQYFKPELQALADNQEMMFDEVCTEMKKRYDGYRFSKKGDNMYNPFSVLHVFFKLDFGDYWFETGTPTFLVSALKNTQYDIRKFNDDVTAPVSSLNKYRVGEADLTPLLYQSGYLTIKSFDKESNTYTLGFPNEEVKYGFLNELIPAYAPPWGLDVSFSAVSFVKAIRSGQIDSFLTLLKAFYASIPYDLEDKRDKDEKYYQMIFYLIFTLMGQMTQTEVKSADGRTDAVVKTADSIHVFEFKMDDRATAEEALAQINNKGYMIPYTADSRRLVKIGVEFSIQERGLKRWLTEII